MSNNFIWTKEQCAEAYDDLMIKIAMSSYAEIEGRELLKENERLKKTSEYQATPEVEKRIRQTVQKGFLQKSIRHAAKGLYSVASKVAVVFLVVSTALGTTMVASADFRSAVYKLVFTYEKQYTLIELDSRTALEFVDSEIYTWEHAYAPTMMPQGYTVSDVVNMKAFSQVVYTNHSDGYIEFNQSKSGFDSTIQVDTENADTVQTIFINESEGILVSKNGITIIVWRVGNTFLDLESNEDAETLIMVAKSIRLLK